MQLRTMIPRRGGGLLALAGAAVLAAPATALAAPEPWAPWRTTFLVSRAADGGFPNGPSRNAQVSQDGRWGGRVAFESDATDIVGGDTNGATDIFVVNRRAPYPNNGSEWEIGANERVSMAADGSAANGRSYGPSIDGSPEFVRPHCVAFVSEASNLVAGDTNGQPDAFVRDLARNRTYRVSVDSRGRQANGPTTEVSIDGNCTRIAFTSRATNLAMTSTKVARQKVAVTGRPRAGSSQVYVHAMPTVTGVDKPWKNATWLASASSRGRPGNGDSFDPSIANQKGKATAFTSRATNLAGGDGNGVTDVYLRASAYNLRKWTTRLVSANAGGRAGNGPSAQASTGGAGRVVAFATQSSDIIPGDGNAQSDISRADMTGSRPSHLFVSHGEVGGRGNAPSSAPSISYGNQFVMFQSDATNFEPPYATRFDGNGSASDAFLWTINRRRVFTESVNSESESVRIPSTNPQQSSHGNYLFFETRDTSTDRRPIGNRPGWDARNAEQVYLRYLGPQ